MRAAASRAAAISVVSATGKPVPTRGAGRPAALAASLMRGTVCSFSVLGPVIQVIVPSDSRPASASILGPRGAIKMGQGGGARGRVLAGGGGGGAATSTPNPSSFSGGPPPPGAAPAPPAARRL